MKIGELARRTGLRHSRIRYYERIGLLKAVDRQINGYRLYPPEAEVVLRLITMAQAAGFTLEEIQLVLPADAARWNHDLLAEMLSRRIREIEEQMARLDAAKAQMMVLQQVMTNRPEGLDCAANTDRIMSIFLPGTRR